MFCLITENPRLVAVLIFASVGDSGRAGARRGGQGGLARAGQGGEEHAAAP